MENVTENFRKQQKLLEVVRNSPAHLLWIENRCETFYIPGSAASYYIKERIDED